VAVVCWTSLCDPLDRVDLTSFAKQKLKCVFISKMSWVESLDKLISKAAASFDG
jgi:hypothetical protein